MGEVFCLPGILCPLESDCVQKEEPGDWLKLLPPDGAVAVELELSLLALQGDSLTTPGGDFMLPCGVTHGDTVLLWLPTDDLRDLGGVTWLGVDCEVGDGRLRGPGLLIGDFPGARGGDLPPARRATGLHCAEDCASVSLTTGCFDPDVLRELLTNAAC